MKKISKQVITTSAVVVGVVGTTLGIVLPLTLNRNKKQKDITNEKIKEKDKNEVVEVPKNEENSNILLIPEDFKEVKTVEEKDGNLLDTINDFENRSAKIASVLLNENQKNLELHIEHDIYISNDKSKVIYIYKQKDNEDKKIRVNFDLKKLQLQELALGEITKDNEFEIQKSHKGGEEIVVFLDSHEIKNDIDIFIDNTKITRFQKLLKEAKEGEIIDFQEMEAIDSLFAREVNENIFKIPDNYHFQITIKNIETLNDTDIKVLFSLKTKEELSNGKQLQEDFEIIYTGFKSYNESILNTISQKDIEALLPKSNSNTKVENVLKPKSQTINKDNNNFDISFSKWKKLVDKINWEAVVTFENKTKSFSGTLKGFLKPQFSNAEIAQAKEDIKKVSITVLLNPNVNKSNRTASSIDVNDFQEVISSVNGFEVEIENVKQKEDSDDSVLVEVKVYSKKYSTDDVEPITVTKEINGFASQEEIDSRNRLLERNRIQNIVDNLIISFNNHPEELLLDEDSLDDFKDFIVFQKVKDANNEINLEINPSQKGVLDVGLKFTSKTFPEIVVAKSFQIDGFASDKEVLKELQEEEAKELFDSYVDELKVENARFFKTNKINKKQITISDLLKNPNENIVYNPHLTQNSVNTTLEYSLKKNNSNDTTLEIEWTLKSTNYDFEANGITQITGFQSQKNFEENIIYEELNLEKFLEIVKNQLQIETDQNQNSSFSVMKHPKPEKFQINNKDNNPTEVGVTFDYWFQNKQEGKIDWKAHISLGNKSKIIEGVISGFKKESVDQDNLDKAEENLDKALTFIEGQIQEFLQQQNNASDGEELKLIPGIPWLPRFWNWLNKTYKNDPRVYTLKRENYDLNEADLNSRQLWDFPFVGGKNIPYDQKQNFDFSQLQNNEVDADLEFQIDYNSARINPDDPTQLLIDIKIFSKTFPNKERKYTVTYIGFKNVLPPNLQEKKTNLLSSLQREVKDIFNIFKFGAWKSGFWETYLDFESDLKNRTFWNQILNKELSNKIKWNNLNNFVELIEKIQKFEEFNLLKDKTQEVTRKINNLQSEDDFSNFKFNEKEELIFEIKDLVNKFMDSISAKISNKESSMLSASISELQLINRRFVQFNEETQRLNFLFEHEEDQISISNTYWKDLINEKMPFVEVANGIIGEHIGTFSFIAGQKIGELKAVVQIINPDSGNIEFTTNLKQYVSEEKQLQQIVNKLENNSTFLTLKKGMVKEYYSVQNLNLNDFQVQSKDLSKEFQYKVTNINQDEDDETIANILLEITSLNNASIKKAINLKMEGFASEQQIDEYQGTLVSDNDSINSLNEEKIKEKFDQIEASAPEHFSSQIPTPEEFSFVDGVIGIVTSWTALNGSINYEITLVKNLATKKITGTIGGFKKLPKNDALSMKEITVENDLKTTKLILELYNLSNISSPLNGNSIQNKDKEILINLFELNSNEQDYASILEILKLDSIIIEELIFSLEESSTSGEFSFVLKANFDEDFSKKISLSFKDIKYSFAQMQEIVDNIEIKSTGIGTTYKADFINPEILFQNTEDNSIVLKELLEKSLLKEGDLQVKNLVNYLRNFIQQKMALIQGKPQELKYNNFLKELYDISGNEEMHLKNLLENSQWEQVLQKYDNQEFLSDIENLVTNLVNNINLENNVSIDVDEILSKILFKVNEINETYELQVGYMSDEGGSNIWNKIFYFENEKQPPFVFLFENIFENYQQDWVVGNERYKNGWGIDAFDYNANSSIILYLNEGLNKNIFENVVWNSGGALVSTFSIKGYNIFGKLVSNMFNSNSYENSWIAGDLSEKYVSSSERGDLPSTIDSIDDIY